MTLIELTVVLIVIGILATLAMPLFTKTIESTKGKEVNVALDQIWAGERIYRTEQGHFFPKSSATEGSIATINTFLRTELDGSADRNWNFSIFSGTDATFTGTGTRIGGPNNGETVTVDQAGNKGGTFSP